MTISESQARGYIDGGTVVIDYDPIEIGLVTSVAHPGGNVTGLSQNSADFGGKRLELMKELVAGAGGSGD